MRFDRHAAACTCFLTFCKASIRIDISKAITFPMGR